MTTYVDGAVAIKVHEARRRILRCIPNVTIAPKELDAISRRLEERVGYDIQWWTRARSISALDRSGNLKRLAFRLSKKLFERQRVTAEDWGRLIRLVAAEDLVPRSVISRLSLVSSERLNCFVDGEARHRWFRVVTGKTSIAIFRAVLTGADPVRFELHKVS
jgi:hypothetical protein